MKGNDVLQVYPVGCRLAVAQHRGADILASKHLEVVPEHLFSLGNLPIKHILSLECMLTSHMVHMAGRSMF